VTPGGGLRICNIMRMLWGVGQNAGDKLGGEALQDRENGMGNKPELCSERGMTCKIVRMAWGVGQKEWVGSGWPCRKWEQLSYW
jgi:hypothetical protein